MCMTSTVGGAMGGGAPIQQLPTQGGAATPPTKDPGTLGGGPLDVGTTPGSLAGVLQNLVSALQSVVSALGGTAGGGPVPDLRAQLMQLNPPQATTRAVGTTSSGRSVTVETSPSGPRRLVQATGFDEVVTLGSGEVARFNPDGLERNDLDEQMLRMDPQFAQQINAVRSAAFAGKPSLTEAETSALQAKVQKLIHG